jgi:hypothetical protein
MGEAGSAYAAASHATVIDGPRIGKNPMPTPMPLMAKPDAPKRLLSAVYVPDQRVSGGRGIGVSWQAESSAEQFIELDRSTSKK